MGKGEGGSYDWRELGKIEWQKRFEVERKIAFQDCNFSLNIIFTNLNLVYYLSTSIFVSHRTFITLILILIRSSHFY